MTPPRWIVISAPGKIHLLGEHAVVYGKPAIISSVDLRIFVSVKKSSKNKHSFSANKHSFSANKEKLKVQEIVEQVLKDKLKIKIPQYELKIKSDIPIGAGLGSSAASSAALITALLTLVGYKWDLNLINELAYEAEKVFHGNPSGGDNSTVVHGGFIWFRKEMPDLKLIQPLNFIFRRSSNFVLINTGTPKESTTEMVSHVKKLYDRRSNLVKKFLEDQEKLVRELLPVINEGNDDEMIRIIRAGERNLESIGVASKFAQEIIRKIEKAGGAAKICGAGASDGPTGVLLCYHKSRAVVENVAKSYNLPCFTTKLGVEGVKVEK